MSKQSIVNKALTYIGLALSALLFFILINSCNTTKTIAVELPDTNLLDTIHWATDFPSITNQWEILYSKDQKNWKVIKLIKGGKNKYIEIVNVDTGYFRLKYNSDSSNIIRVK